MNGNIGNKFGLEHSEKMETKLNSKSGTQLSGNAVRRALLKKSKASAATYKVLHDAGALKRQDHHRHKVFDSCHGKPVSRNGQAAKYNWNGVLKPTGKDSLLQIALLYKNYGSSWKVQMEVGKHGREKWVVKPAGSGKTASSKLLFSTRTMDQGSSWKWENMEPGTGLLNQREANVLAKLLFSTRTMDKGGRRIWPVEPARRWKA
ncbi:hypothetical protein ACROYT_G027590 [Oculina patagonica]